MKIFVPKWKTLLRIIKHRKRIWLTVAVVEISPKDVAAEWDIPQLPKEHATLLDLAGKTYRGEYVDKCEGMEIEVIALVIIWKTL